MLLQLLRTCATMHAYMLCVVKRSYEDGTAQWDARCVVLLRLLRTCVAMHVLSGHAELRVVTMSNEDDINEGCGRAWLWFVTVLPMVVDV